MNSKVSALVLLASVFAVGCNGTAQDSDGMDSEGIDLGDTDGAEDSDSADGESEGDSADSDSGSDSGNDSFPDSDGYDSDGVVPTCGGERILLSSARPNVMLLLDKSGSMTGNAWDHDADADTETVNRWTSLHDVTSNMLETYGDTVNFGAVLFPALDSEVPESNDYDTVFNSACRMADHAEVAVAEGTRDTILAAMPGRDAEFEGATPTREAILNGLNHLETVEVTGPRAMVLVTDGAANCVYDSSRGIGSVYDTELEQTVRSAYADNGVPTYVVGIDITAEHPVEGRNLKDDLNAVADAGGVARDGDERFYNVADQETLAAALDEIARRVECTVELEDAPSDPDALEVEIDGELMPLLDSCSEGNGWRYAADDHSSIELCNDACVSFHEVQQLDTTHVCDPAG
ncbi:MAG: vWA domain-containing protein [Nannocystales bacterium]